MGNLFEDYEGESHVEFTFQNINKNSVFGLKNV